MATKNGKTDKTNKMDKKREFPETKDEEMEQGSDSSSDESWDGDGDESDVEEGLEVQVEFEAQSPHENDFDGIKRLLKQLFSKCTVHLSDLADIIIAQKKVGSVVLEVGGENEEDKNDTETEPATSGDAEDEDEVYGLCTVVSLNKHKDKESVKQVKSLIQEKCKENGNEETTNLFSKVLNEDKTKTGLLINERFINIPPQLALPLFKSLRTEIEEARKGNKSDWSFDHLILISKSYKEDAKSQKKKKKKKAARVETDSLSFANMEDELIFKECSGWFSYEASKDEDETAIGEKWNYEDLNLRAYRTVMILPYKKLDSVIKQMEELLAS